MNKYLVTFLPKQTQDQKECPYDQSSRDRELPQILQASGYKVSKGN